MKKIFILLCVIGLTGSLRAQLEVYPVTSWEFIFSGAEVEQGLDGGSPESINAKMRFTGFFHWEQDWHMDFTDHVGIYSGFALRNIGLIMNDSRLNDAFNYSKIIRRSYNLGVPLALKLGSFDNHFYVFGGGELELLFHYKEKYWENGQKYKTSEWFSNKTKRFLPSVFAGVQFPGGLNLKFKYYLDDFLNHDFKGSGDRNDYTTFKKSQVFYVSLCWQFNTRKFNQVFQEDFFETAMYK
jgi:hypothetical protein